MKISVIIPTYNESDTICDLLQYIDQHGGDRVSEILVVDGQSSDDTVQNVKETGFNILISEQKGRAAQMNLGAQQTSGDILYFVHADSIPPKTYPADIINAIQKGAESGCYRFKFDADHWLLKINAWFTRFDRLMCRGGDQTLFVHREVFEELNGFKNYEIMEDFEMISRLRKRKKFKIIPNEVLVSARKYEENNYLKVNFINLLIFTMFYFGASRKTMVHAYQQLIAGSKFGETPPYSQNK